MNLPENAEKDLWFPDGNVIIRAGERLCRVYKGFLTSQSPVLADMFSIPQPPDAQTIDGLPVVVFPDAPEEVLHWLKAMLSPESFEVYPVKIEMRKLFAVLRLSHKYDVQYLRQRALYHLSTDLLTELETTFPLAGYPQDSSVLNGSYLQYHEFLLDVVPLAREVDAAWLLPPALHYLHIYCRRPATEISLARLSTSLSATDLARLWRISDALPRAFPRSMTEKWNGQKCASCTGLDEHEIEKTYRVVLSDPFDFAGPADDDEDSDFESRILIAKMCGPCYREVLKDYRELCETYWEALPNLLELPKWPELRAMKARDIGTDNAAA